MSLIVETVSSFLPPKRKSTPSGWISFDAVCCHHNGQSPDKRKRGGLMITEGVSYHCFNCGFKSSWHPGRTVSAKFKKLLTWLSVPDDLVNRCIFDALRSKEEQENQPNNIIPQFFENALPIGSFPLLEWIKDPPNELAPILEYLLARKLELDDFNWHWTNEEGFNDRLIIPFYNQGKIVGYTARKIVEGKPKYIASQQPHYVFNLDNQVNSKKILFLTEGPIDAIFLDGVSVNSNEISSQQAWQINRLNKSVVVVPDRDRASLTLIEQALKQNWSVSLPDWYDEGIKDVNDAVLKYGRLFTYTHIYKSIEHNPTKIKIRIKSWLKK